MVVGKTIKTLSYNTDLKEDGKSFITGNADICSAKATSRAHIPEGNTSCLAHVKLAGS